MAKTEHYFTRFEEGLYYHVYNRSVDRKPMFFNDGNYEFFLKRYNTYLSPVIDTNAYCLMGNHFHLLMRVRNQLDLTTFLQQQHSARSYKMLSNLQIQQPLPVHDIVSHQFQKFFQSYAMAFNKQRDRIGTLFQTPFKRVLIENETDLARVILYIHANPQEHEIKKDFRDWHWSSYERMLLEKPTQLKKAETLNLFGGKEAYIQAHLDKHLQIKEKKSFRQDRFYLEDD